MHTISDFAHINTCCYINIRAGAGEIGSVGVKTIIFLFNLLLVSAGEKRLATVDGNLCACSQNVIE